MAPARATMATLEKNAKGSVLGVAREEILFAAGGDRAIRSQASARARVFSSAARVSFLTWKLAAATEDPNRMESVAAMQALSVWTAPSNAQGAPNGRAASTAYVTRSPVRASAPVVGLARRASTAAGKIVVGMVKSERMAPAFVRPAGGALIAQVSVQGQGLVMNVLLMGSVFNLWEFVAVEMGGWAWIVALFVVGMELLLREDALATQALLEKGANTATLPRVVGMVLLFKTVPASAYQDTLVHHVLTSVPVARQVRARATGPVWRAAGVSARKAGWVPRVSFLTP
jgi:hypothetical protein